MNVSTKLGVVFGVLTFCFSAFAAPKYGPNAEPLSRRTNLEYFQKNPAPKFWSLMPYYLPQTGGQQCSAATFTMVLNAARTNMKLTSDDQLVTIKSLLEKYSDDRYRDFMSAKITDKAAFKAKFDRSNVGNRRLAEVIREAIRKLGIETPNTRVEIRNIDAANIAASRKAFHADLVENEKSASTFIVMSFLQNRLTGDPDVAAHVAPIGAYDSTKHLVLVMDPDREWFEPYWSPEDKVFDAVADPKADNEHPGWLFITI